MLKSTLSVIAGFVLWSVLWLAYNVTLKKAALLPADTTQPFHDPKGLVLLLFGSCVMSAIAGYATAAIARTGSYSVVIALGMLLLAAGIFFQSQVWQLMPLWYHSLFLVLLLPLCIVGAWLRQG